MKPIHRPKNQPTHPPTNRPVCQLSRFHQVFCTVVFLTLLAGGISLWLSAQPTLSPQQDRIFENAITTWQMGVGAIFGLLGSKAADWF